MYLYAIIYTWGVAVIWPMYLSSCNNHWVNDHRENCWGPFEEEEELLINEKNGNILIRGFRDGILLKD